MAHSLRVRGFSRRGFRVDQNSKVNYTTEAIIDLDDKQAERVLTGQYRRYFSPPEFLDFKLRVEGVVATATTASGLVLRAPRALVLKDVRATVGTANTGAALILDVHKVAAGGEATAAGTTIFTTQSRRPTIPVAVSAVQTLTATGTITAGTYSITFAGETTSALAYDADAATITTALNALGNVASGDIVVSGDDLPTTPATFTFAQVYAGRPMALMTANNIDLTGGTYAFSTTTPGILGTVSALDATNGVPQVTSWAAGDILRVEIDQVGSSVAGSNLTIQIRADLV